MAPPLAGVVLAAGYGTRLRPLTEHKPKALLEVGGEVLLDHALHALEAVTSDLAVNAHAHAEQIASHVRDHWPRVHVSIEQPEALGTAGALARLRDDGWIADRAVAVHNADAWHRADVRATLVDGWDGERIRLLVVDAERGGRADFGPYTYAGVCLLPPPVIARLPAGKPSGLYEVAFADGYASGRLELVPYDGPWFDCGTPADYAAANLAASRL